MFVQNLDEKLSIVVRNFCTADEACEVSFQFSLFNPIMFFRVSGFVYHQKWYKQ